VSSESLCSGHLSRTGSGVHCDWLADDEAISNELADGLTGVGVGDLGDLIGVEPDLALSASDNGGRKALLGTKVNPRSHSVSLSDGKVSAGRVVRRCRCRDRRGCAE